jgi:hypothetical protein
MKIMKNQSENLTQINWKKIITKARKNPSTIVPTYGAGENTKRKTLIIYVSEFLQPTENIGVFWGF